MAKYRKRPVVVEAIQWTGLNVDEIKSFAGGAASFEYHDTAWKVGEFPVIAELTIMTLEGEMKASPQDYIIKGVNGEFYPCKPDIFDKTYFKVPQEGEYDVVD